MNVVGFAVVAIRPPDEPAEADPEVHHHALHRERLVPLRLRSEAGDQGRLAGPEAAVPDPGDRAGEEPLPGMLDEGVGAEADRHQPERERERDPAADPVDERADDRAGDEPGGRVRPDDQSRRGEVDVADVVEVDEEERVREPVSQRIDQRAGLQRPHGARERGVQRPQVRAQELHGNGTYPRLHWPPPGQ